MLIFCMYCVWFSQFNEFYASAQRKQINKPITIKTLWLTVFLNKTPPAKTERVSKYG